MPSIETIPATEQQKQPETVQISGIPRAVEALESLRDINLSVIYVQLEVGSRLSEQYGVDASAFYISREWWDDNVGHSGTFSEMASSFDNAYKGLVSQRIAEITQSEVIVADDAGELSVSSQEDAAESNSTKEPNRSYEMLENLGNALAEAEDNAVAFAKIVGFDTDEAYSEAFLVDLVAYVDEKYALSLSEEDLDKIYGHVKVILKEQQRNEPDQAAAAHDVTETTKDGQTFDEYSLKRQQAFAQINKGEMPDIDGSLDEADPAVITERQALLERYQDFDDFWDNVDAEHDLIASGLDSDVYAYEQDGEQYIVRAVKDESLDKNPAKTDDYVSALLHGKGVQGLEQIVACSYKDGVVVSERAPGKSLEELLKSHPEAVDAIPDEHLEQLLAVFQQMQERGLVADVNRGNLIYDEVQGFTLVDYMWCPPEHWSVRGQSLDIKIEAFEDLAQAHFPKLAGRFKQLAASGKN